MPRVTRTGGGRGGNCPFPLVSLPDEYPTLRVFTSPARGNLKRCKKQKPLSDWEGTVNSVALEQGMFSEDCSFELMARAFSSETWKPMS